MKKPAGRRRFWYWGRIYFTLFSAAAVAFAMLEGSRVTSALLYIILLILPASALYVWFLRRRLRVRHGLDTEVCARAEPVRYTCVCRNKGPLSAPWVYFRVMASRSLLESPAVHVLACAPYETKAWQASLLPLHRGRYAIAFEDAACADLFNLVRLKPGAPNDLELLVLPRIIPIREEWKRRFLPSAAGFENILTTDEPAVESRDYRYGDSMRRIHWNLTARSREIMVREYEKQAERRLLCVLDTTPFEAEHPLDCEDGLIEACLSVARYALECRFEVAFAYGAGDGVSQTRGNDLRFFDRIHRTMADIEFTAETPPARLLAGAEKAYTIALFTMGPLSNEFLDSLPAGVPAQIFLMKTQPDMPAPDIPESDMLHITVLETEKGA